QCSRSLSFTRKVRIASREARSGDRANRKDEEEEGGAERAVHRSPEPHDQHADQDVEEADDRQGSEEAADLFFAVLEHDRPPCALRANSRKRDVASRHAALALGTWPRSSWRNADDGRALTPFFERSGLGSIRLDGACHPGPVRSPRATRTRRHGERLP